MNMATGISTAGLAIGTSMNKNNSPGCESVEKNIYFHTGKFECILFKGLYTQSVGGIVGACFAVCALAIILEAVKVFRKYLLQQTMIATAIKHATPCSTGNGSSSQETIITSDKNIGIHMMSCSHFVQILLHMLQALITYCLMLIFMMYNAWLCSAVILGAGVGHILFVWRKGTAAHIVEKCH